MITVSLARELQEHGLRWTPGSGDRFVVSDRGMDGEVFVVSEMTIEVHDLPQGSVIGFNGTTEWALDSVDHDAALWLPRESQLRELLGGTFRSLERSGEGWLVRTEVNGVAYEVADPDAEQAYASALLHLLAALR